MSSRPTLNEPPSTYTIGEDQGVVQEKAAGAIDAFKSYEETVSAMFSGFKDEITGYESAFYGESSGNVKAYVDNVIDKCQELMQQIKSFETKINESMTSYKAQQETIYGGLTANAGGNDTNA